MIVDLRLNYLAQKQDSKSCFCFSVVLMPEQVKCIQNDEIGREIESIINLRCTPRNPNPRVNG